MTRAQIDLPRAEIAVFCRTHHIRRLAVLGSVLRPDFRPDSDIDVLVEFEPGHVPGLGVFRLEEELCRLLGRKVALSTPELLGPRLRDNVLREAQTLYAPPDIGAMVEAWKAENRAAIEAANRFVMEHGLPLAGYRLF